IRVHHILVYTDRRAPRSTLFPYTTLFRSLCLFETGIVYDNLLPVLRIFFNRFQMDGVVFVVIQLFHCIEEYHQIVRKRVIYRRRSEEHTSELQSRENLVCRLLLEKKKTQW